MIKFSESKYKLTLNIKYELLLIIIICVLVITLCLSVITIIICLCINCYPNKIVRPITIYEEMKDERENELTGSQIIRAEEYV